MPGTATRRNPGLPKRTRKPPAVVVIVGTGVALTPEELLALFNAACFAGAYQRPGVGPANVDITPSGVIRRVGALDSARMKLAVALGPDGGR